MCLNHCSCSIVLSTNGVTYVVLFFEPNIFMCDGRLHAFQVRMDAWTCFWVTQMFVTLITAASNHACEDGGLILYDTYFRHLRDYNCSENYRSLHTIHLANNNLRSLEGTGISDVSSLLHLLVVHNLLTSLEHDVLSNLTELTSLDLSYNKLESFKNGRIFSSQSKLKVLRLSFNLIVTLDVRVLVPLHSLKELNLSGNPFGCDCELWNTVKWSEERNLSTAATCKNGLPWTVFVYEDCTYITFIVTGTGIGIIILVSVVVEVWVCCLRRARRDTVSTESTAPADSPDNVSLVYYNNTTCPSSCSTHAPLLKPTDSSSAGYAPITQRLDMRHAETSSNPGTEYGFAASLTYAEPYRNSSNTSVMYAVPYHHTTGKTGESVVSDEDVFCAESNSEVYSDEISVRNSLYL